MPTKSVSRYSKTQWINKAYDLPLHQECTSLPVSSSEVAKFAKDHIPYCIEQH